MSAPPEYRLPVVAVVGRPNVGKSSLVNRILGRREAIVEETPGVTRDRRHFTAEWGGRSFEIVDTGGIEPGPEGLDALVADQARRAMEIADLILVVVDASVGATEDDLALAQQLRQSASPIILVANKVDGDRDEPAVAELWSLGLGEPRPVSALHGRRSGDLLAEIVDALPDRHGRGEGEWASVAIVGRPNVGKSSLLNALLGETRSIVDSTPGTTRDPVDSVIEAPDGHRLRLVDTAGMRRQVAVKDPLEYFSWLRSRKTLTRVDVAVLVVDVADGVTSLDQRLAEAIVESGRACVIVLNKWDLLTNDDREGLERQVIRRLRFLTWASLARTSAVTRRGVDRLMPAVIAAVEAHRRRVPTAEVNRILADAQSRRPHPRTAGKSIRVLYASQARTAPPTFVLFANARLQTSYLRYLERALRESAPFQGTPLKLQPRTKSKPPLES